MSRPETVIELQQVSKVYRTGEEDTVALDRIDLKIEPGEFVAVMGPSGTWPAAKASRLNPIDALRYE